MTLLFAVVQLPQYTLFVPAIPPKNCITFVFNFSSALQSSQEKLMAMLLQNFWEQTRCIMGDVQIENPHLSGGYHVPLFSADSPHKKLTPFGNLQMENTFISSLMKSALLTLLTLSRIKILLSINCEISFATPLHFYARAILEFLSSYSFQP